MVMSEDDVRAQLTTPLASPAYPRGPYRFTDRGYLNITYRTKFRTILVLRGSGRPGWLPTGQH